MDWDYYIPVLGMALRAAVTRSTVFTANMSQLGCEVNFLVNLFFVGVADTNHTEHKPAEYPTELLNTTKEMFATVQENLRTSQARQKQTYDVKCHINACFMEGT